MCTCFNRDFRQKLYTNHNNKPARRKTHIIIGYAQQFQFLKSSPILNFTEREIAFLADPQVCFVMHIIIIFRLHNLKPTYKNVYKFCICLCICLSVSPVSFWLAYILKIEFKFIILSCILHFTESEIQFLAALQVCFATHNYYHLQAT